MRQGLGQVRKSVSRYGSRLGEGVFRKKGVEV